MMFTIEFYETANGQSDIKDFLEQLRLKRKFNKDARIQFQQISFYIQLLQENGTRLSQNILKPLKDGIWELRPGSNRVLFFFYDGKTYVLLHHFRKKSQKIPHREIERAIAEKEDYIARRENGQ